jgi:L-serine dehydratase
LALSVFDMFSIGIGPSSSHTVGPMRAAGRFVKHLRENGLLERTTRVRCEFYGSLGATGKGHGSDKAVLLGLEGHAPDTVDVDAIEAHLERIARRKRLHLNGDMTIAFECAADLVFHAHQALPTHPNGMRFHAYAGNDSELLQRTYYSVGGGFVVSGDTHPGDPVGGSLAPAKYPISSCDRMLRLCKQHGFSISSLMLENETCWRSEKQTREGLLKIWHTMEACVTRGCEREGTLPGGLAVKRRAPGLHRKLKADLGASSDPLQPMDWVALYALAVGEENAAGGRVVTAPTNGAAGIIPAVLHFYRRYCPTFGEDGVVRYLLTAGAIGLLYKINASISGAEVGCQGEVGVACSMAAGALTEVMGGTPEQVENAAEIAMEHNLGLTCDPVGGLVQVPCIERNAMAAVTAINASRLALRGDGTHRVSLDKVIDTMRQTGLDMNSKYKETARGGLAIHVIAC